MLYINQIYFFRLKKDEINDEINKKKLDSECFALNQKHKTIESQRKSVISVTYAENQR